ncbi:hypothetical protein MKW92_022691, partial [Papaver armeniacum]
FLISQFHVSLRVVLDKINVGKAIEYIVSCMILDGGFGSTPGGESDWRVQN